MNTTKNRLIQKLLLSKKGKKQNGFTLIELMVVIAIVGILSAVGLPEMLKAQDRAKASVAQQEAVAAAKECAIYSLAGGEIPDGSQYESTVTIADLCAEVEAVTAGSDGATYTITLTNGVPGPIVESVTVESVT